MKEGVSGLGGDGAVGDWGMKDGGYFVLELVILMWEKSSLDLLRLYWTMESILMR